jgi:hypothetical protein
MKKFLLVVLMVMPALSGNSQSLVINEVVYSNQSCEDAMGNTPDWFELYNASGHTVNLHEYKITDDTSKTEYWEFPSGSLDPGEYLVVYASGKDTVIKGQFHTNFKLGVLKESLFLIDEDGNIADQINPQCVPVDHSYARQPDGAENLIVTIPTPGSTNNNSESLAVSYIRDSLTVNYASGFYSSPISISLSHLHEENTILYTLDGDDPDEDSYVFEDPFLLKDLTPEENRFANIPETLIEPGNKIFKANILRAMVYSSGCPASNEITATYFINDAIKNLYKVPIVSLITDKDNLFDDEEGIYTHGNYRNFDQHGDEWERLTHVEIFDSTGRLIIDQDAGLRIHGRGSRRSPQKSLRIYAEKEYGSDYFKYPLFSQKPEIDSFKVLLLRTTGGTLGPLLKEELCNYLVSEMDVDYPAGETIILFINGEYWGIYNLMERQNKYYVENNYRQKDADVDIIAYDRSVIVEEGTMDEYNRLVSLLESTDPSSDGFYEQFDKLIDLNCLIDYYVAQLFFANMDWPQSNVELWRTRSDTAKWRYFFFDSDASMQWVNYDHLSEYNNDIDDLQRFDDFSTVILKVLMRNDQFRKLFFQKFHYHLSTTFITERVTEAIRHFESKYAPLIPDHIYRWHNPVDYAKWQENIGWLKTFAVQRPLYMREQLQRNFGNPYVVYPNPCQGSFSIEFVNPVESVHIRIFSVKGDLVKQWQVNLNDFSVHYQTALPPGLYILQVVSASNSFSEKLIIQ